MSWLDDYASTASKYVDAPKDFQKIAAFWTFGAAVGKKARFQFGMVPVYPNLYAVLIGRSGAIKKSLTKNFALDVLDGAVPDLDLPGRGSPEAFRDSLEEKNWYGVLHFDEMYEYLSGRRKDYRADMDTTVMELFAHGRKTPIRTKVSGEIRIPNDAMISFIAPTTVDMLAAGLKRDDFMSGKMARFLLVEADQDFEYPVPPAMPHTTIQYLATRLKASLPQPPPNGVIDMKEAPGAREMLEAVYYGIKERTEGVSNPLFAGSFSRAQVYAVKLAMIHALAHGRHAIEARDYEVIMPIVTNWAECLTGLSNRFSVEDRFQGLVQKAEDFLRKNPRTNQRELQRFMRLRKLEMQDVMEHLSVAGIVETVLGQTAAANEITYKGNGHKPNGQKDASEGTKEEAPPEEPLAKPRRDTEE